MLENPIRDRQAERREATRREILDAAWALARQHGLPAITLREVAHRVGMRAPSLYSHFPSKHAIYDAMFSQAWSECEAVMRQAVRGLPRSPRAAVRSVARTFFDFAVADLARHQLMNQRTIPGFKPTADAYAPAVRCIELLRQTLAAVGVRDDAAIDLYTALVSGLIDQQQANDPGGDRWARLLDSAADMWSDHVHLPGDRPGDTGSR